MKKIVYRRPDGGISVVTPTKNFTIEEILAKDVPQDATDVHVVEDNDLPSREHRDAWIILNGKVSLDQAKVNEKEQKKARRQSILNKLKLTEEELKDLLK